MPKVNNTHRGGTLRSEGFSQSGSLNSQPKSQIFNLEKQFDNNSYDFHPELHIIGLAELEKAQGSEGFLPTVVRQTKEVDVTQPDGSTIRVKFIQIVIDVDDTQYVLSTSSKALYKFFTEISDADIMAAHQQNERLFVIKSKTVYNNYKWMVSREPPSTE